MAPTPLRSTATPAPVLLIGYGVILVGLAAIGVKVIAPWIEAYAARKPVAIAALPEKPAPPGSVPPAEPPAGRQSPAEEDPIPATATREIPEAAPAPPSGPTRSDPAPADRTGPPEPAPGRGTPAGPPSRTAPESMPEPGRNGVAEVAENDAKPPVSARADRYPPPDAVVAPEVPSLNPPAPVAEAREVARATTPTVQPPSTTDPRVPNGVSPNPAATTLGTRAPVARVNVIRGNPALPQVLLSFDGGSGSNSADAILEALRLAGVRTTFFLTGEFVRKYPELTRRILRDGHEVGNHTDGHIHLTRWEEERNHRTRSDVSRTTVRRELGDAEDSFRGVTGRPMAPLWRAPYGEINDEILDWAAEAGYQHVGWTGGFDSLDWVADPASSRYRTPQEFVDLLAARMARKRGSLNGVIILMHLNSWRPEPERFGSRIGSMINLLEEAGYELVNASTLLQNLRPRRDDEVAR